MGSCAILRLRGWLEGMLAVMTTIMDDLQELQLAGVATGYARKLLAY